MKLLAIDTAFEDCSVGVAVGDRPPVLLTETIGRGHRRLDHAEQALGMAAA
ncbi:MAG: tRNA (adenosine(37)-N6)-threonylcarbamoyltransferase complex dimerization subunit type 1 TsaB, partial [Bauldia sp.]